jgi:hypothetical protein
MKILIYSILFMAWYILSLAVSERMGKKSKIGVEWSFFISMMFSPVIGWIVAMASKRKAEG